MSDDRKWYRGGLRFECTSCAACCKTHEDYAYVYLSDFDVISIAAFMGKKSVDFLNEHCLTDQDEWAHLTMTDGDCNFLGKDGRCKIYPVRPKQCETWPFWRENMDPETWNGPVKDCCPGVGRGKLYSAAEIDEICKSKDKWYGNCADLDD